MQDLKQTRGDTLVVDAKKRTSVEAQDDELDAVTSGVGKL
jgi:hypothetical protein